jgi:hypothetical protein
VETARAEAPALRERRYEMKVKTNVKAGGVLVSD